MRKKLYRNDKLFFFTAPNHKKLDSYSISVQNFLLLKIFCGGKKINNSSKYKFNFLVFPNAIAHTQYNYEVIYFASGIVLREIARFNSILNDSECHFNRTNSIALSVFQIEL